MCEMTTQDILSGFHGMLDKHGFSKNDAESILLFAQNNNITDSDEARHKFCAWLEEDGRCHHMVE